MRKALPFLGALLVLVVAAFSMPQSVVTHKTLVATDSVTDTLIKSPIAGLYRTNILLRVTDSDTVVADTVFARNIKAGVICKSAALSYTQYTDTVPTGAAAKHTARGKQKAITALCYSDADSAILYKVAKTTATGKIGYNAYFWVERVR